MNPLCPECETELKEDFGIVNCTSCGVVCFVDIDGSVRVQDEEMQKNDLNEDEASFDENWTEDTEEELQEELSLNQDEDHYDEHAEEETEALGEFGGSFEEEDLSDDVLEENFSDGEDEQEEDFQESKEEPSELEENEGLDLPEDLQPISAEDFLKDLEVFSQGAKPSTDLEHVYYDLVITGLESSANWDILIETLADRRLRIFEEDLLKEKESGQDCCVLKSIPLLRLVVVHSRIAPLGFNMNWFVSEYQEEQVSAYEERTEGEGSTSEMDSVEEEVVEDFQEEDYDYDEEIDD